MDPLDDELAERGRALIAAAVAETMAPLGAARAHRGRPRPRGPERAARGARAACWASSCPPPVCWPRPSSPWCSSSEARARRACSPRPRWPTRGPVLPAPAEDEAQRHPPQDLDAGRALPLLGRFLQVGGRGRARRQDRGPTREDRVLRQPEGRPRRVHDPRRRHDRRTVGRVREGHERREAVHHDGQGPAHRDVDAQRPHVRAERAGLGARAEAACSSPRGRARAASRSRRPLRYRRRGE